MASIGVKSAILFGAWALSACQGQGVSSAGESAPVMKRDYAPMPEGMPRPAPTLINDPTAAARLLGSTGVTLQWISWDWRGPVQVHKDLGTIYIEANQDTSKHVENGLYSDTGRFELAGHVREIGADYFIFNGRILIKDAPDEGRDCLREGDMRFAITQNRKYWRLQNMEACGDGLTDYIDIYF